MVRTKELLLQALEGTARGCGATRAQRSAVEKAQAALEEFGKSVDFRELAGSWRLVYTTAPDVLVLLDAERASLGLLQIGDIFQSFGFDGDESSSQSVENVIHLSLPPLLSPAPLAVESAGGCAPRRNAGPARCCTPHPHRLPSCRRLTLRVGARYTRESSRTLRLYFEEARIGGLRISELTESLLAPALLPRNFVQMRLLQWLRDVEVTFPLRAGGGGASGRVASAGTYILTFMDNSMLIGRAANSGGVFIFSRAPSSSSALQPFSF